MSRNVDHWLRRNHANRVPRRLVCLDSEARLSREPRRERHSFRLACASFDELDEQARPDGAGERASFDSTEALWSWVVERTAPQHRTVCYAHNLSYDLRLTRALEHLPELGFEPTRVVLGDYSCWARFVKGKRTLMLCDSLTWLPATLDMIAGDLGLERPRLPRRDASDRVWLARCQADVEVLRAAMLNLMEWLHDDELGDWRPTGHAQASAAFRHRFLPERTILVHWGGETREAERRSAWTGRNEVWQPGQHRGPVVEYDYTAAYAWIAERESLPTRLLGPVALRARETPLRAVEGRSVLYQVRVDTETPTLPCELDGRIVWPVGSFETTVWDVELALALAEGATIRLKRAWLYESSPVLRSWARWILAALDGQHPGEDPLRRRVIKAWSRSLIGRFALRYPNMEAIRDEDEPGVKIATVWDSERGRGVKEVQIGRQVFEQDGETEAGSSTPQLMAAIMAHARVRLWRTMQAAGFENVLYVDTDSVLVNAEGADRLEARLRQGHFPGLRRKGTYRSADLRAPRNIDLGDERRIAGLPRHAGRKADGSFEAEVWESLPAALRRRRPSGVFRLERSFRVGHQDFRRRHTADGHSEPLRVAGGELVA